VKKLIIYCTGGLGNRMFPVSSGLILAEQSQRELCLYWPKDRICSMGFEELYDNNIRIVDENFLNSLDDTQTEYHAKYQASVFNDHSIYGRHFLNNKLSQGSVRVGSIVDVFSDVENILVSDNNFMDVSHQSRVKDFNFKSTFMGKADKISHELGINTSIMGVHARGTDFTPDINFYQTSINNLLNENPKQKIFVCSDDRVLENGLFTMFPNNTIFRSKENYTIRVGNGIDIDSSTLEDSIIDLLLLSKTNFKIYNPLSTFGLYAKLLSEDNL
jgi:hypothetical protein